MLDIILYACFSCSSEISYPFLTAWSLSLHVLGRSLMIGWRENSWNPERVPSVFTFVSVCPFLRTRATDHSFWPRNLIFGSSDPWDMRKKRIFLFFEIFIFTLFIGIFRFFPYITLVHFLFQATGHSFTPRNVIFWVEWSLGYKKETHFFFFEIFIFTLFLAIRFFSLYNTSKFLVSSYWSQFFTSECDIWVTRTLYHKILKTLNFKKIHFFTVKWVIFRFFGNFSI